MTIAEVIEVIRVYYDKPENGAGGNLHIVLDDGNIETCHIEWCRNYARENGDVDGVELANILLGMSEAQMEEIYTSYDLYNTW